AAGQYFEVDRRKTTLTTEIRAGTVTFLVHAVLFFIPSFLPSFLMPAKQVMEARTSSKALCRTSSLHLRQPLPPAVIHHHDMALSMLHQAH
ncbi:hypothetical protein HaLaN_28972, partial [Haematococcus lacustris]